MGGALREALNEVTFPQRLKQVRGSGRGASSQAGRGGAACGDRATGSLAGGELGTGCRDWPTGSQATAVLWVFSEPLQKSPEVSSRGVMCLACLLRGHTVHCQGSRMFREWKVGGKVSCPEVMLNEH